MTWLWQSLAGLGWAWATTSLLVAAVVTACVICDRLRPPNR
jgi:hypothetical protein